MPPAIPVVILLLLTVSAMAAEAPDDRRVEEEKRKELKSTEAQYYDGSATRIDPSQAKRDFFEQLQRKKTADHRDAVQVLAMLGGKSADGAASTTSKPLARGTFAIMLKDLLRIKGGLTLRLFKNSGRYAHKELVYEGIMIPGSSAEIMSGRELAYTFVQAADYIAKNAERQASHD